MESTNRTRKQRVKNNPQFAFHFLSLFTVLHGTTHMQYTAPNTLPTYCHKPALLHPHTQNHYTLHHYLVLFLQLLKVKRRDLLLPTRHVPDLPDSLMCETSVKFGAGYLVSGNRTRGATKQFPLNQSESFNLY